jgi:hypothetical protein
MLQEEKEKPNNGKPEPASAEGLSDPDPNDPNYDPFWRFKRMF